MKMEVVGVRVWCLSGDLMLIVGVHQMFLVLPCSVKLMIIILIAEVLDDSQVNFVSEGTGP